MASLDERTTALVTGASQGIGLAVASALRARGVRVVMVARSMDRLTAAATGIGGIPFAADVSGSAGIDSLTGFLRSEFAAAPDVLVNAAGAFSLAAVAETPIEAFDALVAANLRAPFELIRRYLPDMLKRGSGDIITIGSIAGRQAFPGNGAYSASKYGLRGLHEVLDVELKGTGVRATLIEPAATDTELWDSVDREKNPGLPERNQMLDPAAVAEAVLFAIERPNAAVVKYMGIERS